MKREGMAQGNGGDARWAGAEDAPDRHAVGIVPDAVSSLL